MNNILTNAKAAEVSASLKATKGMDFVQFRIQHNLGTVSVERGAGGSILVQLESSRVSDCRAEAFGTLVEFDLVHAV